MSPQLHKMNCNYFAGQALYTVNETASQGVIVIGGGGDHTYQHDSKSPKLFEMLGLPF